MHAILASGLAFGAVRIAGIILLLDEDANPFVACGCLGFLGMVMVAILALNIALLIWVARDAKSRGLPNDILWMILVMLTGIIGLIIYLFTRPQGNLVPCANCGNKRRDSLTVQRTLAEKCLSTL